MANAHHTSVVWFTAHTGELLAALEETLVIRKFM